MTQPEPRSGRGLSTLRIITTDFLAGARTAEGVTIVIDVFRACSLQALALAAGAERILPVEQIDAAFALKRRFPEALLVGERHARKIDGFDCGNSPTEVLACDVSQRTLIHTTHAGTQGLVAASRGADRVFTGAFVNLEATVAAVLALAPTTVTIVAMGLEARERCLEDSRCQDWLVARLRGASAPGDATSLREQLREAPAAAKFFDPAATYAPREDFTHCTALDSVPFAVTLGISPEGLPELRPWHA